MGIISLPWRAGNKGYYAQTTTRRQEVESRMFQLLFTNPYERFMRNDIGIPMMDWIFEPVDEVFSGLVEVHAKPMLQKWIDNIRIQRIDVIREEIETDVSIDTVVNVRVFWSDLLSEQPFESDFQHNLRRPRP